MIFVDTGAWFAAAVADDPDHEASLNFFDKNSQPLVTTDYVLDEVTTLLRARLLPSRAIEVGTAIIEQRYAKLLFVQDDDVLRAFEVFRKFSDKSWSFTDCTSYVLMQKFGITTACSFDHHFRQFGTVIVVP
jgi:predicted nucleic acid-binding protein